MKQLFAIYTIVGLILTPFIYSNNATGYRDGSTAYNWGKALGGALYWPSYLFSIEPEVDSASTDSFQKSIIDIIEYRNNKLFTGSRNRSHGDMVFGAIDSCLAIELANTNYKEIFSENTESKEIDRIRSAIMNKMDGDDFADIIKAGEKCRES